MKIRNSLITLACFLLLASPASAVTGSGTKEDPIILKCSNYYPDSGPIGHGIHSATYDFIEKQLGGRVKFERYWAGSLHSLKDGFKALRSGLTDFTQTYVMDNTKAFQYYTADGLPWLYKSVAHATAATREMYPKWYKKEFERQGSYVAMTTYFDNQLLITKKPVRNLEDLKGMKIMGQSIPLRNTLKALGATPVYITGPEIFIALQRGVIDGLVWSAGCTIPWRYNEAAKYCTPLGIAMANIHFSLNKNTFDALPKDLQKDIYHAMQQGASHMAYLYTELEKNGYEEIKQSGMEIINLDDAEMKRWRDIGLKVSDDYRVLLNNEGLEGDAFMKDLKETADKYNAMSIPELNEFIKNNVVHGLIDGF